jgi:hypothetical protein
VHGGGFGPLDEAHRRGDHLAAPNDEARSPRLEGVVEIHERVDQERDPVEAGEVAREDLIVEHEDWHDQARFFDGGAQRRIVVNAKVARE